MLQARLTPLAGAHSALVERITLGNGRAHIVWRGGRPEEEMPLLYSELPPGEAAGSVESPTLDFARLVADRLSTGHPVIVGRRGQFIAADRESFDEDIRRIASLQPDGPTLPEWDHRTIPYALALEISRPIPLEELPGRRPE